MNEVFESTLSMLSALQESVNRGDDLLRVGTQIERILTEVYGFRKVAIFLHDAATDGLVRLCSPEDRHKSFALADRVLTSVEIAEAFPVDPLGDSVGTSFQFAKSVTPPDPSPTLHWLSGCDANLTLRSANKLVGCILLRCPDGPETLEKPQLESLLLFANYAAQSLQLLKTLADQDQVSRQRQHMNEISLAITSNEDPKMVFLMVRNAVIDMGLVDRVGLWIIEDSVAWGTWGTDDEGNLRDEHHRHFQIVPGGDYFESFINQSRAYEISTKTVRKHDGSEVLDVPHAFIPLVAGEEVIGFLSVDTLLTKRKITPAIVAPILVIADQAAVAIQKSRLLEQRELVVRQQQLIMDISVAIAANVDPDSIYLMVRDAVRDMKLCDRIGIWIIEGTIAKGTWGTDMHGDPIDEHDLRFELASFIDEFHACLVGDEPFMFDNKHPAYTNNVLIDTEVPYAVIPLKAHDQLIGVMTMDSLFSKRRFTVEKLKMVLPLARQAGVAVHNSRLLSAANEEIERRRNVETMLVQQQQELLVARDEALAGAKVKSEFLANMSHEIRTPMNGVIGLSSMLMETPLSSRQAEYLGGIQKSAHSLLSIIDEILDFSKLEAGMLKIDLFPFNLRECIEDVSELIAAQMKNRAVELNCFVPVRFPEKLIGDGHRVRQMLTNLLGNAVKFTERGKVAVRVTAVEEDIESVVTEIAVSDTGIGIDAERKDAIFESFTQADGSSTRKHGGSGLGLTITKQIVELMGGSITLESQPGRGSTFTLRIAFKKQQGKMPDSQLKPFAGRSALVFIESVDRRQIVADYGRDLGLLLYRPADLENAKAQFRSVGSDEGIDFLILDTDNQVETCEQALSELRLLPATSSSQLILISNARNRRKSDRAEQFEHAVAVSKPIRLGKFVEALASLTENRQKPVPTNPQRESEMALNGLRILLVEDNEVNALVAASRLEGWGCTCVTAQNGLKALEQLAKATFDVVLMDLSMPEMDGIQATEEIRKRELSSGIHVPIIAMTAHAMAGDRERCIAAGMDDYIAKPIQFDHLFDKVKHWGSQGSPK